MENDEKLQERKSDDPASAPYYVKRPQFGKEGPSKLRQEFSRGMTMFLVIMACVVLYFALLRLDSITNAVSMVIDVLKPILYGMVIAYLLNPIVKQVDRILVPRLEKYMQKNRAKKCSRGIGVILSLVFLFALITALCNMLIPELVKSIRDLIITLPGQLNNVVDWFNHLQASDTAMGILMRNALEEGTTTLQNWLRTDLMPQVNTIMSNLTVGVLNILNEVLNFLIGLIVSVYLLFSKEQYSAQCKKMTYAFLKTNHANMLLHLTKKVTKFLAVLLSGKLSIPQLLAYSVLSVFR